MTSSDTTSTGAPRSGQRIGLWLIGARGSVATTAVVGLHALAAGTAPSSGCATTTPAFEDVPLAGFADIVVGGHDVALTPLLEKAMGLAAGGMFPASVVAEVAERIDATDAEIRLAPTDAASQQEEIDRRAADIVAFRERHGLARVVVIDVASTEVLPADRPEFHDLAALRAALARPGERLLPPSSIAALSAVVAGAAYACFTPSTALAPPALEEWATEAGVPIAGQDGKTGETLLRSVLAPMFTARGMRVLSWAGANLLGGGDGQTLADPEAVRSKLVSKNRGLRSLLGDDVVTPLHIDNVPDLGDVKTAWDHAHAEGFLGSRITVQTIWSAYDSALAAPLILDLARLLALADEAGVSGPVGELGFFFKDPWGSDVHGFAEQTAELVAWAARTGVLVAERRTPVSSRTRGDG
ncbi:inositol-3-phosphate synthase [Rathayibacter rathayi]|nr:inositol-3-phosphate synthase [Rathayibacter rathayi]PPF20735.1 myo-inositol-1-phosphate synthase [Rathayibacter rathayi]PPG91921.1 myo-inositol-1-phosphate synthase [Rathayibacter rathayi]PPI66611.1 myo-inositol-1-phosphate synthase [Rathayibacter rathayi]